MSTERITEHNDELFKLNEKILELEQRARYAEQLCNASTDRMMAFDTDLKMTVWNRTCELLSGRMSEDIIGQDFFSVFPTAKEYEAVVKAINMSLKGMTVLVPAEDGSFEEGYQEGYFIPLKDDKGLIIGVLYLVHDVAHRVKTENELKRLNSELVRENNELKEQIKVITASKL